MIRWLTIWCATMAALAQAPPAPTGTVEGIVSDATTGSPIRKATVTFRHQRQDVRIVTTDTAGRFQAAGLSPGDYRLTVNARAYVPVDSYSATGTERPNFLFTLAAGQVIRIVPRLTPAASVSGRIVDEDEDPVAGIPVQLWEACYPHGRRERTAIHDARAVTDDRGLYRIAGIAPGRYYVSAFHTSPIAPPSLVEDDLRYVRSFYPGGIDPVAAAPIQLAAGEAREQVSWKVAKVATVRVTGRSLGGPLAFASLLPDGPLAYNDAGIQAVLTADGGLEWAGIAPGSYRLMGATRNGLWLVRDVSVGSSDVRGLTVSPISSVALTGQVRVDESTAANLSKVRVVLSPLFPASGVFQIDLSPNKEGHFFWEKPMPGRYRLSVANLPQDCYLKTIRLGDQTLPDGRSIDLTSGTPPPLDLVLSPKAARVTGVAVIESSEEPAAGTTIVLTPTEPERQGDLAHYFLTTADASGRFAINGLAPGAYRAHAVESVRDNLHVDPAFAQIHAARAASFTAEERGRVTLRLTYPRGSR